MLKKTYSRISVKLFSKKTTGQMKIISAEIRFRWMNASTCLLKKMPFRRNPDVPGCMRNPCPEQHERSIGFLPPVEMTEGGLMQAGTSCLWLVEGMSMMKIGHPLIAPPLYRQDRNGD